MYRILQIAGGLPSWAGTEKYVLDISTELAHRGHAVTLACPRKSVLAQRVAADRIRVTALEMRSACDWENLPALVALVRAYDVVHTHSPLDYVVPAIAARMCGVDAIVMTRHMAQPFASRRKAYLSTCVLYDRVIAVSNFVHKLLVESGGYPNRVEIVPNGIAHINSDPGDGPGLREELRIPATAFVVASGGRMSRQKGFDILLRAVHELVNRGVIIYCVIFGAGAVLEQLRHLAYDLQIDSYVRLPGFRSDVQKLWCAADIAVIPSVEAESFGYTALEALSGGCAVVASRIGGLPEVVGDAGTLIEPGNVTELSTAIHKLVLSTHFRRRMQVAARHRAKSFTLEASVNGIERVYKAILTRRRKLTAAVRSCAMGSDIPDV